MYYLLSLSFPLIAVGEEGGAWLKEVSKRIDPEAVLWVRQQLKERLEANPKSPQNEMRQTPNGSKRFQQCLTTIPSSEEPSRLLVFMSLSVPDTVWIELSKDVKKEGGVFILRGLPENSFRTLATRLKHLKELGVEATIQLDPLLFKKYNIEKVPAFVLKNIDSFKKISGSISVAFALRKLTEKAPYNPVEAG